MVICDSQAGVIQAGHEYNELLRTSSGSFPEKV